MIPRFRAWDKLDKEMHDSVYPCYFNSVMIRCRTTDEFMYYDNESNDDAHLVLMQSTGLLDKNGVEIYEGDVVKGYSVYPTASTFESFLMGEVYYTNRGTWDCYSYILGGFNEQVEVIGNIYENKELIEVENE